MSRDVGVGQLVDELEQRGDRLPFEIGAFVALEACEGLLQESVKLEPDDVRVTLEGSVLVADSATSADPDEAARSLVSVLARLLVAAGPGVPPYLLQLVKESATGEASRDLRALHDAIEASLIPINRGASRRVLARLVRESDRPPAPEVPEVDPHELDAELDELLRDPAIRSLEAKETQSIEAEASGVAAAEPASEEDDPITERIRIPRELREPIEPQGPALSETSASHGARSEAVPVRVPLASAAVAPSSSAERSPLPKREIPEPVTATIRRWQPAEEPQVEARPEPEPSARSRPEPAHEADPEATESPAPVEPSGLRESAATVLHEAALDRESQTATASPATQRRGGWGVWLLVAALGMGVYGLIASGTLQRVLQPAAPAAVPAPSGSIEVTVTPADAQIFVFVGRGPAVAEDLPVESAHEFIVFGDGLRPARASVPTASAWGANEAGPLYELAVQPQPMESAADVIDFGEPLTTPSTAAAGSSVGSVRVVTNPPGAKVYRFVGVGPSAMLSVGSIHEGQEELVHHPSHETRRAVIGPSDWEQESDGYHARLTVDLPALPVLAPAQAIED